MFNGDIDAPECIHHTQTDEFAGMPKLAKKIALIIRGLEIDGNVVSIDLNLLGVLP